MQISHMALVSVTLTLQACENSTSHNTTQFLVLYDIFIYNTKNYVLVNSGVVFLLSAEKSAMYMFKTHKICINTKYAKQKKNLTYTRTFYKTFALVYIFVSQCLVF